MLGRGRLVADTSVRELIAGASASTVLVRSPEVHRLRAALSGPEVTVSSTQADLLEVTGLTAAQIGDTARDLGISLHELTPQQASLEEAFMSMTRDDVEYHAHLSPSGPAREEGAAA